MNDKEVKKMIKKVYDETECTISAQDIIRQTNFFTKRSYNYLNFKKLGIAFSSLTVCFMILTLFIGINVGKESIKLSERELMICNYEKKYANNLNSLNEFSNDNNCEINYVPIFTSYLPDKYALYVYCGRVTSNQKVYLYLLQNLNYDNLEIIIDTLNGSIELAQEVSYGFLYDDVSEMDSIYFSISLGDSSQIYNISK